jgi:hypothetical protein
MEEENPKELEELRVCTTSYRFSSLNALTDSQLDG